MLKSDLRSLTFSNLAAAEKGRATLAADKKVDAESIRISKVANPYPDASAGPRGAGALVAPNGPAVSVFWRLEWRLRQ